MSVGLIGIKRGMTRIFTEEGLSIPVTVLEILDNTVTQLKTLERDGYAALQVTMGKKKSSRVNKPLAGHYAKAQVIPGLGLWEFRVKPEELAQYTLGQVLPIELLQQGQKIDVTGTSKGRGFAGGVKRHGFRTQDATHGNSRSHRVLGSTGQNQSPGHVFKGKKMAGHMGDDQVTTQLLTVTRVDTEKRAILVKGAVPGAIGGTVIIRPSTKTPLKKGEQA